MKYTRAFPGWVFYFDADPSDTDAVALSERLADRVQRMDAVRKLPLTFNELKLTLISSVSRISSLRKLPTLSLLNQQSRLPTKRTLRNYNRKKARPHLYFGALSNLKAGLYRTSITYYMPHDIYPLF